jgi:hypothetical protein
MDAYEFHVSMKIYPHDRYSPLHVDIGVIREEKLPEESDDELILRTTKKGGLAIIIGVAHAVKTMQDVLITSFSPEEMEVMNSNAIDELRKMTADEAKKKQKQE